MAADSYLAPVLIPSLSTSLDPSDPFSTTVSVLNGGHLSLNDLELSENDNRILFSNGDVFKGPGAKMELHYSSSEVKPGDAFTFVIGRLARLFIVSEQEKVISVGDPELSWTPLFRFQGPHGHHRVAIDQNHPAAHFSFTQEKLPISADIGVNVTFRLAYVPLRSAVHFRLTTFTANDGHLVWRLSPTAESYDKYAKGQIGGDVLEISGKPFDEQSK
jgi:hypothetical protein